MSGTCQWCLVAGSLAVATIPREAMGSYQQQLMWWVMCSAWEVGVASGTWLQDLCYGSDPCGGKSGKWYPVTGPTMAVVQVYLWSLK